MRFDYCIFFFCLFIYLTHICFPPVLLDIIGQERNVQDEGEAVIQYLCFLTSESQSCCYPSAYFMFALKRKDFFLLLIFSLHFLLYIIFKMCSSLVRYSPDGGWLCLADFEESVPSYAQYDQVHFGRNSAKKCQSL